jgi:linoleoyl-CoA desaturase
MNTSKMNVPPPVFENQGNKFYGELRAAVDEFFKKKGIKKTGDRRLYTKTTIIMVAVPTLLVLALFAGLPVWASVLLFALVGVFHALAGFNIMHDACHGSFSSKGRVNNWFGNIMSLLGSHAFIWKTKHNVIHHTYTNVDGVDDDIAKIPALRHCPSQPWKPAHKFQHVYMMGLYAISSVFWMYVADFEKYFKRRVYTTDLPKIPVHEHVIFWVTKLMYTVVYLGLPIYFLGVGAGVLCFFSLHITLGIILSCVFQMAHVVEKTHFVEANMDVRTRIPQEWAVHQMATTANFAPNSAFWTWFTGGLNFQVEHHLFPQISHVHYPDVRKIVQQVAAKYNVPYLEYPTFREAFFSHLRLMRQLGSGKDLQLAHS